MSRPSSSYFRPSTPSKGKWTFLARMLTCCLLLLPWSSAFVVSSRASSLTVTSTTRGGIGGRGGSRHQPLHLLPGTSAFVALTTAASRKVVKNGFMVFMESGWAHVVSIVGFVLLFNTLLGEKLSRDGKISKIELGHKMESLDNKMESIKGELEHKMESIKGELATSIAALALSIDKLSMKRDASFGKLAGKVKVRHEKLSGDLNGRIEKLSGDLNGRIEKGSGDANVRHEKLSGDVKGSLGDMNGKIQAIDSKAEASNAIAKVALNMHMNQSSLNKDTSKAEGSINTNIDESPMPNSDSRGTNTGDKPVEKSG